MNAPAKIDPPSGNTAIWDAVSKTDPAHTKKVNQRGGFTAISAHYQVMRATEQFGPVGIGWGYTNGLPIFEDGLCIVPVTIWHSGNRENSYGPVFGSADMRDTRGKLDSDAPKKAATDGLTKALSHLGFNADVFLGRFDDNKYVEQVRQEFAEGHSQGDSQGAASPRQPRNWGGRYPTMTALKAAMHHHHAELERMALESTFDDLEGYLTSPEYVDYVKTAGEHAPYYLEGERHPNSPPEFVQTFTLEQKARDMIALRGNVPAHAEETN